MSNAKFEKPEFCKGCPINHLTEGYVPLHNAKEPVDKLIVGEASGETEVREGIPFTGGAGTWLNNILRRAKLTRENYALVNTIGCRPPNNIYPSDPKWMWNRQAGYEAIRYCRKHHLEPALRSKVWRKIIALGDHALQSLTGKAGITTWRNSPLALIDNGFASKPIVLPLMHPAAIMRDSKWYDITVHDIQNSMQLAPENYKLYGDLDDIKNWTTKKFAFDLEWDGNKNITICGLSDSYGKALVFDFRVEYREELQRIFESADELIGHNIIGADIPFFNRLGWMVKAKLQDTMLKQHLVMPDMPHSLAFCSSVFTNAVFWKGRGDGDEDEATGAVRGGEQWRTYDRSDAIPVSFGGYGGCSSADEAYRLYNARDTAHNFEIDAPIDQLLTQHDMWGLYWNISVPVAKICQRIVEPGIKIDPSRIGKINSQLKEDIKTLEVKLPDELKSYHESITRMVNAPIGTFRSKTKKCKGSKKDGTNHEPEEITFRTPGTKNCPRCATEIKSGPLSAQLKIKVPDTKLIVPWRNDSVLKRYAEDAGLEVIIKKETGKPTSDKNARKRWARERPEFSVVSELMKKSTLLSTFAKDSMLKQDRLYFKLNVHGTNEGRLSSAGQRKGIDPNIQNQPQIIRQIYVPDFPDYCFIDADWSGAENKITSYLAQDWDRLARINAGADEHADLASAIFQREVVNDKKHPNYWLRKVGKIVNHGLNYGMGVKHLQELLLTEDDEDGSAFSFSLKECKEFIEVWRKHNARTYQWQRETVAKATSQSYLANVFGRKRWFKSSQFMNEAMAFLPASTMADMMLRSMVAFHASEFPQEISDMRITVSVDLPKDWRIVFQVHDSLVFTGPTATHIEAARLIDQVMSQKFPELGDFSLKVDIAFSESSWGECKPIDVWKN